MPDVTDPPVQYLLAYRMSGHTDKNVCKVTTSMAYQVRKKSGCRILAIFIIKYFLNPISSKDSGRRQVNLLFSNSVESLY